MKPKRFKSPTIKDLKKIFGDKLQENQIQPEQSDVDGFVDKLRKASEATKKHSIQFG